MHPVSEMRTKGVRLMKYIECGVHLNYCIFNTNLQKCMKKNYYSYKIKLLLLRFSRRCFYRFSNHFTIYISWECIPCIIIVVGKTLNNLVAVFIWELLLGQILWIISSLLQILLTWIWFICYLSSDDNLKTYKYWIIFFCN